MKMYIPGTIISAISVRRPDVRKANRLDANNILYTVVRY